MQMQQDQVFPHISLPSSNWLTSGTHGMDWGRGALDLQKELGCRISSAWLTDCATGKQARLSLWITITLTPQMCEIVTAADPENGLVCKTVISPSPFF